jgi:hypothetical protein
MKVDGRVGGMQHAWEKLKAPTQYKTPERKRKVEDLK